MAEKIVYVYRNCSTCRKALAWLDERGIAYEERAIRETPPSTGELALGLQTMGKATKIINTSSKDYRASGLKDQLESLSPESLFEELRKNGNLVKRPFVVTGSAAFAGFNEELWESRLL
jgi:arsenate reductase